MAYTVDELAAYAKEQGLTNIIVAGYTDDGRYVFCSTDGNPVDIRKIIKASMNYVGYDGAPLPKGDVSPERRHTVAHIPQRRSWRNDPANPDNQGFDGPTGAE